MSEYSVDANVANFEEQVLLASHQVPVVVDFWAEWCGPCRTLKPILEKLAAEYGGRFILAKVNSDENQELSARYGVRGIPNVKAFYKGEMVNEFTGALPESQVRAFIDKLIPSAAEPLCVAAQEARARGEHDVALSLLADAMELDPASEIAQLDAAEIHLDRHDADRAGELLKPLEHKAKNTARVKALQARLKLVAAGAGSDPAALQSRIDANPADLDARLQLANALALAHDYRPAMEQLLNIVQQDRHWQDEAARKMLLDLFTLLGSDARFDGLVREFRVQLARTLN
jgi:putative thioredoxin